MHRTVRSHLEPELDNRLAAVARDAVLGQTIQPVRTCSRCFPKCARYISDERLTDIGVSNSSITISKFLPVNLCLKCDVYFTER